MVMVLQPLHELYRVKRVVVSTYQSVTGTGKKAVDQLMNERNGVEGEMAYRYMIDMNLIPQIDVFMENGYTKEEMKVTLESRKIMNCPELKMSCTAVRIPTLRAHSEAITSVSFNEAKTLMLTSSKDKSALLWDVKEMRQRARYAADVPVNAAVLSPVREHVMLCNNAGLPIGEVTSGLLGPSINQPVAMAYVQAEYAATGTRLNAMVRGKPVPMQVSAMTFVPTRYFRGPV
jgi:aspartate-semialdehyde dehydrogenase